MLTLARTSASVHPAIEGNSVTNVSWFGCCAASVFLGGSRSLGTYTISQCVLSAFLAGMCVCVCGGGGGEGAALCVCSLCFFALVLVLLSCHR